MLGAALTFGVAVRGATGKRATHRLQASDDVVVLLDKADASSSSFQDDIATALAVNSKNQVLARSASEMSAQSNGGIFGSHPDIVFAVLTGKEHHDDRAEAVKSTWCGEISACIFFSDTPSESLPTVSISFEGLPLGLSQYNRAQLRYVPVLNYMRELITSGEDDTFQSSKWMMIVDDDTFVFYHNLDSYLQTLDHTKPIYTGDVIPDNWLPVSKDGFGNDLGVSSDILFINGGGGSVFSRAALQVMDTELCVNNSMPGQPWWRWQSDWMIGACAAHAGIAPTSQEKGRFNQFVCSDDAVQFCEGREYDVFDQPNSLHPIRATAQMHHLYQYYANSSRKSVSRVRIRRVLREKQSTNGEWLGWPASSGLELSE